MKQVFHHFPREGKEYTTTRTIPQPRQSNFVKMLGRKRLAELDNMEGETSVLVKTMRVNLPAIYPGRRTSQTRTATHRQELPNALTVQISIHQTPKIC